MPVWVTQTGPNIPKGREVDTLPDTPEALIALVPDPVKRVAIITQAGKGRSRNYLDPQWVSQRSEPAMKLTGAHLAALTGVTEACISQLRAKALRKKVKV